VSEFAAARSCSSELPISRTELKREARVERIERAAAKVFAEKGYDGANFSDIAAVLDLRGPSLYHYFSSKEDLFLRCLKHSAEQVFTGLRSIAQEQGSDPLGALHALIREQVLIEVRDFPEFVPLFFKIRLNAPDLARAVLDLRKEHAQIFEHAAFAVRDRDGLDAGDVRVWLGVAFGALAYLQDWYDPAGRLGADELAQRMADTLTEPFHRAPTPT